MFITFYHRSVLYSFFFGTLSAPRDFQFYCSAPPACTSFPKTCTHTYKEYREEALSVSVSVFNVEYKSALVNANILHIVLGFRA